MQIEKDESGYTLIVLQKEEKAAWLGKVFVALSMLISMGFGASVGLWGDQIGMGLSMVLAMSVLCIGTALVLVLRQKPDYEVLKLRGREWCWEMSQKELVWKGDVKDFKLQALQQDKNLQLWLRSGEKATMIGEKLKKDEKERLIKEVHTWQKQLDEESIQHAAEDVLKKLKR